MLRLSQWMLVSTLGILWLLCVATAVLVVWRTAIPIASRDQTTAHPPSEQSAIPTSSSKPPGREATAGPVRQQENSAKEDTRFQLYMSLCEKLVLMRAFQLLFGLLLGVGCTTAGILIAARGIEGAVDVEVNLDKAAIKLKAASIGAALVLGGLLLIGATLTLNRFDIQPPAKGEGTVNESGIGHNRSGDDAPRITW